MLIPHAVVCRFGQAGTTPQCPQACRHRACSLVCRALTPPQWASGLGSKARPMGARGLGPPGAQAPLGPSLQVNTVPDGCSSPTSTLSFTIFNYGPSRGPRAHMPAAGRCQRLRGHSGPGRGPAPPPPGLSPLPHTHPGQSLRARGTCPGPHSQPDSASCR